MLHLVKYTPENKGDWNNFVNRSRNGTFLFHRDYMEYHSDRFKDCSFLIYDDSKLIGLIPGNVEKSTFFSHKGLTYGGIISSLKLKTADVIDTFKLLNNALRKLGIKEVIYKPVPFIYHRVPAQEDIYALYVLGAKKIACNISSSILQENKPAFSESRKSGLRKANKEGIIFSEKQDFKGFWKILEDNLSNKYGARPVHSIEEIEYLKGKFPDNIKFFGAESDGQLLAGTVIYITGNVVHVQYISASQLGKAKGALDIIFFNLINKIYVEIPIFDFGQSTENNGLYLNESLIFQKEGFGARGTIYEVYQYNI